MLSLAVIAAAAVGTAVLVAIWGRDRTIVIVAVLGLFVVSRNITDVISGEGISDFAPPAIALTTAGVTMVICFLLGVGHGPRYRVPMAFVLFLGGTAVLMATAWDATIVQWAGISVLAVSILAWVVGDYVRSLIRDSVPLTRVFIGTLTLTVLFQLMISILQYVGVSMPVWLTSASGRIDLSEGGRVVGTFGHPGTLGKIMFVALIIAMVFFYSEDAAVRRWSYVLAGSALVVVALTVSRANALAVGVLLAGWIIFGGSRVAKGGKLLMLALLGVLVLVTGGIFLDRILSDTEGGYRPRLLAAGLQQISEHPLLGTGINSYISVVGQTDSYTALGYPVHNAFLYFVASAGIPLAVLFFWPHVQLFLRTLPQLRSHLPARIAFFAAPGWLIIIWTGWGLYVPATLMPWMFSAGFIMAELTRHRADATASFLEGAKALPEPPQRRTTGTKR